MPAKLGRTANSVKGLKTNSGSPHEYFPKIKVNELGNLSKNYWKEGMQIEDGSISVCTYEGLKNIGFNAYRGQLLRTMTDTTEYCPLQVCFRKLE
ncbi:MAG: hypothetical protein ACTTKL_07895 [Treponema sp.]